MSSSAHSFLLRLPSQESVALSQKQQMLSPSQLRDNGSKTKNGAGLFANSISYSSIYETLSEFVVTQNQIGWSSSSNFRSPKASSGLFSELQNIAEIPSIETSHTEVVSQSFMMQTPVKQQPFRDEHNETIVSEFSHQYTQNEARRKQSEDKLKNFHDKTFTFLLSLNSNLTKLKDVENVRRIRKDILSESIHSPVVKFTDSPAAIGKSSLQPIKLNLKGEGCGSNLTKSLGDIQIKKPITINVNNKTSVQTILAASLYPRLAQTFKSSSQMKIPQDSPAVKTAEGCTRSNIFSSFKTAYEAEKAIDIRRAGKKDAVNPKPSNNQIQNVIEKIKQSRQQLDEKLQQNQSATAAATMKLKITTPNLIQKTFQVDKQLPNSNGHK